MQRVLLAWAIVAVTAVVGVVAQPPEASAAIGIPDWLDSIAETAYNACVDVPQSIVSSSGSVGTVAAGGIVGAKAVIPVEGLSGVTAAGQAQSAMLADWLATAEAGMAAQGMTAAQISAAGEAWSAAHVGYAGMTQAELMASWTAAASAEVAAPVSMVGSATGSAVAVDGAAVAGTGAAGTASGAGATLSASTVGLAALTAAGAFCGTINAQYYIFGDVFPDMTTDSVGVTTSGLHECVGSPAGMVAGDACFDVQLSAPALVDYYVHVGDLPRADSGLPYSTASWGIAQRGTDGAIFGPGTYTSNVPLGTARRIVAGTSSVQVVVPCPNGLADPAGCFVSSASQQYMVGGSGPADKMGRASVQVMTAAHEVAGTAWVDVGRQSRGWPSRIRATNTCKSPITMTTTTVTSYSAVFMSGDRVAQFEPDKCPPGTAPIRQQQWQDFDANPALNPPWWQGSSGWGHLMPRVILDNSVPDDVQGNATTLQCLAVGATACPLVPSGSNVLVGGSAGVARPASEARTSDLTQDVWTNLEWPTIPEIGESVGTDPDPDPGGTTTTVPASGPGGETQAEACEAGQGAGCPADGAPPAGTEDPPVSGSSCWPDGWGWFNPAEWVLKPIKCALVWAFWDQESADEMAALGDEHGWTDLVTESSVTTSTAAGPCVDMDYADICTEPILSFELPSAATVLLTAAVLFFGLFEVIGLFARITGGS